MNNPRVTTMMTHLLRGALVLVVLFLAAYVIPLALGQRESSKKPSIDTEAQCVWQNPLPQGNHLFAVSFIDANNGTAVGWYGIILRTTDGGANWVKQTSGTTSFLYGVSFTDANNGTAVGEDGTIVRTTDGGANWVNQTSGTSSC